MTPSLFRKKTLPPAPPPKSGTTNSSGSLFSRRAKASPEPPQEAFHVDDFGVPTTRTAFREGDDDSDAGLELMFGYTPIATDVELGIAEVGVAVAACSHELRTRGLDTPLILSTGSLDAQGSSTLIRSYLEDRQTWADELHLAPPLAIASFLKWVLARLVNEQGAHGFLPWHTYAQWKTIEQTSSYPLDSCISLFRALPRASGDLLDLLLTLFSSVAAHSTKNGMVPRRCAAIFCPYVFGLSHDRSFDECYAEWQRGTDALEHCIISFLRNQKLQDGRLPTHLEPFVLDYPGSLNISYAPGALPRVPKNARVEEVMRVRRLTRFHSRNLIASAGTWEVPLSEDWSSFFAPRAALSSSTASISHALPLYTPGYRHLLNIRPHSFNDKDYDQDEGELQRHRTLVERDWSRFGQRGFQEIEARTLEFDLTEGERNKIKARPVTMTWGTFADSGFGGRETFAPSDLIFRQNLAEQIATSHRALDTRLLAAEKALPPFPYDTTAHEEGKILVDQHFFETWADVLVCAGWVKDEVKESNFALIQYKARPRGVVESEGESRTLDRWVICEEMIPKAYRDNLGLIADGKLPKKSKRISFLRRRKSIKPITRLNASQISMLPSAPASVYSNDTALRSRDDPSVFTNNAPTTKVRLGHSVYAPSMLPGSPGSGIVEEKEEAPFSSLRNERDGSVSPPPKAGFLARISSRVKPRTSSGPDTGDGTGRSSPADNSREPWISVMTRDASVTSELNLQAESPTETLGQDRRSVARDNRVPPPTSDLPPPPPPPKLPHAAPMDRSAAVRQGDSPLDGSDSPVLRDSPQTGHRSSYTTDEDPYDGLDEEDDHVESGTVLFRGSRSYPRNLTDLLPVSMPLAEATANGRILANPPRFIDAPAIILQKPVDHRDSLPPSPKPYADVPEDDETRRDRAKGPWSDEGHGNAVGQYDESESSGEDSRSKKGGLRLTQYGFPHLGGVVEEQSEVD